MQNNLCSAHFEMLFWTLWTCEKHSESLDMKTLQMIRDVNISGLTTRIAALQNL